jgi:hypothetical protein
MKKILILLLPIMISCSALGLKQFDCIENRKFKKEFLKKINYIESHIFSYQDSTFRNSLIFISNYAPVSFNETMNYARIYPPKAMEKDKIVWLKWYEENKCKNIQLKKSYPIPEQYKEILEY